MLPGEEPKGNKLAFELSIIGAPPGKKDNCTLSLDSTLDTCQLLDSILRQLNFTPKEHATFKVTIIIAGEIVKIEPHRSIQAVLKDPKPSEIIRGAVVLEESHEITPREIKVKPTESVDSNLDYAARLRKREARESSCCSIFSELCSNCGPRQACLLCVMVTCVTVAFPLFLTALLSAPFILAGFTCIKNCVSDSGKQNFGILLMMLAVFMPIGYGVFGWWCHNVGNGWKPLGQREAADRMYVGPTYVNPTYTSVSCGAGEFIGWIIFHIMTDEVTSNSKVNATSP